MGKLLAIMVVLLHGCAVRSGQQVFHDANKAEVYGEENRTRLLTIIIIIRGGWGGTRYRGTRNKGANKPLAK